MNKIFGHSVYKNGCNYPESRTFPTAKTVQKVGNACANVCKHYQQSGEDSGKGLALTTKT